MELETATIFETTTTDFATKALSLFRYQWKKNEVYRTFCDHLKVNPDSVTKPEAIPFLPIEFFKSHTVLTGSCTPQTVFTSSGTTGVEVSKHHICDLQVYEQGFQDTFHRFYGDISEYCLLALLPSYLERKGSSLVHMVSGLIQKTGHPDSGFYLNDLEALAQKLKQLEAKGTKTLLIGVSFALLDLAAALSLPLKHTVVMETGGMKGRRKEMIREDLHRTLQQAFGEYPIHSEYGMTELLSQAYSKGEGVFYAPPWMRVFSRDTSDPLKMNAHGKTGGLNIIDLANVHSCAFIATQDLGKVRADGAFEVLGRFDHADIRGCNLMTVQ
ncbi:MAG: acyl transferase [Bacteroidota bacterium]